MTDLLIPVLVGAVGLAGLLVGGTVLVGAAVRLVAALRVSPLALGIILIGVGTSLPELAVTLLAVWSAAPALAVGNLVGSNIANVLLVLGVAALVAPLQVRSRLVRVDVPLLIAASVGVWLLALDGWIGRFDGLLLGALMVAYLGGSIAAGGHEAAEVQQQLAAACVARIRQRHSLLGDLARLCGGALILALGTRLLVMAALDLTLVLRIDALVMGLTLVAVSTSLPELVVAVQASLHGQRDMAVGSLIGASLFNLLAALGLGALLSPGGIQVPRAALLLDMPIMIATAALCLPVLVIGLRLVRAEGAVLLGYFLAYLTYALMRDTPLAAWRQAVLAALLFLLPLAVVALLFMLVQARARASERQRGG